MSIPEALSIVSFLLFVIQSAFDLYTRFRAMQITPASPIGGGDVNAAIDGLAKLVDALNKSSPALVSLLASIAFIAVSRWK